MYNKVDMTKSELIMMLRTFTEVPYKCYVLKKGYILVIENPSWTFHFNKEGKIIKSEVTNEATIHD